MYKLLVFFILSIPIIIISWRAILKPRSHGFYRFIGWECVLWLLIHNILYWFVDPFSISQIIAWICLIYSLILLIPGVILMKRLGKPKNNRGDSSLYTFEQTSELIDTGIFKYIRHPLYGSLIFLTWGTFLKNPRIDLLFISFIASMAFVITAKIEEKEIIAFFGEKYRKYMKRSKMFVPYIF
ncbi:methyltransferase family protein [Bacteroidota bacterium]